MNLISCFLSACPKATTIAGEQDKWTDKCHITLFSPGQHCPPIILHFHHPFTVTSSNPLQWLLQTISTFYKCPTLPLPSLLLNIQSSNFSEKTKSVHGNNFNFYLFLPNLFYPRPSCPSVSLRVVPLECSESISPSSNKEMHHKFSLPCTVYLTMSLPCTVYSTESYLPMFRYTQSFSMYKKKYSILPSIKSPLLLVTTTFLEGFVYTSYSLPI
jgi:hypothetical protein